MNLSNIKQAFSRDGFTLLHEFCNAAEIQALINTLDLHGVFSFDFKDVDSHNLFKSVAAVAALAMSENILALAKTMIGESAAPFYAIVLDKSKYSNWGLDWHQDLKIAVKEKKLTPGYCNWTEESGIVHVIPPVAILEKMVFIRIHLDSCHSKNGSMWAIPGSHRLGVIDRNPIQTILANSKIFDCEGASGTVMLMFPLLLHKSPYSLTSQSRRILQIEYRATELENGLAWNS